MPGIYFKQGGVLVPGLTVGATKEALELNNVDNTSDATKPVSGPTATFVRQEDQAWRALTDTSLSALLRNTVIGTISPGFIDWRSCTMNLAQSGGSATATLQVGRGVGVIQASGLPLTAQFISQLSQVISRPASNSRIDLVYARVATTDPVSQAGGEIVYVQGTPAASPVAPATPALGEPVATITVPSSTASSFVLTDLRRFTALAGGIVTVPNSGARLRTVVGTASSIYVHQTDTEELWLLRSNGTWELRSTVDTGWKTYSAALTGATVGNGTIFTRYRQQGNTVEVYVEFVLGSTSTVATGASIQLPVLPQGYAFGYRQLGTCFLYRPASNTLNMGIVTWNGAYGQVWTKDGAALTPSVPWAWAAGDVISWTMRYEIT